MTLEQSLAPHPGEILSEEFLKPPGATQVAFARHIDSLMHRIHELISGKHGFTPSTDWLLAQSWMTTPEFWVNMQVAYDLARNRTDPTS
jgi:addiction module HigA family antidote